MLIEEKMQVVEAEDFKIAMRSCAAPVGILTHAGPAGRSGITITSFVSVSACPPRVLVCVNNTSQISGRICESEVFCVSLLSEKQLHLAEVFSGETGVPRENRFLHGEWDCLSTGSPALTGALVNFDCRLHKMIPCATHSLMIGSVVSIQREEDSPLLYSNRAYSSVASLNV